jgi:protein O-GlcNAc transferase
VADDIYSLGVRAHEAGDIDQAMRAYEQVLAESPRHSGSLHLLGVAFHQKGDTSRAAELIESAIALDGQQPRFHYNLGVVREALGNLAAARDAYENALALQPLDAAAAGNLFGVLLVLGEYGRAEEVLRAELGSQTAWTKRLVQLGQVLKLQGHIDEALAVFRAALTIDSADAATHSRLLFASQYATPASLAESAREHREWGRRHGSNANAWAGEFADRDRDPHRPLRIGFVSCDFLYHPVSMFLAPVLDRLDRNQVTVTCYADGGNRDGLSQRLRMASDTWREVAGFSHEQLARTIRDDAIDILFDLGGHTDNNRLPTFTLKPAPLQISWVGYVGTTGLSAMDYVLADDRHVPPELEPHYTEKILRMPAGYVAYEPPSYAPDPGPLPLSKRGAATFGSLNNACKFSGEVIGWWSRILRAVPDARLVLKYKGCDEPATARRIHRLFQSQGVAAERVELRGASTHVKHLSVYQEIDVALDPFPYSGGITTCEALWMGAPVVTLPGQTFASRHALSHLTNGGVRGTIATDPDHYAQLAIDLVSNPDRLSAIRANLRTRLRQSPLCDLDAYAANLQERLRTVWRHWCDAAEAETRCG